MIVQKSKDLLMLLGSLVPGIAIQAIDSVLNYLDLIPWLRKHGFSIPPHRFHSRPPFWREIANLGANANEMVFLEFGVFEGASLSSFSSLITNSSARFIGFDSFEGLPQDWNYLNPKGKFNLKGKIPIFMDPRISLQVGRFSETLTKFIFPKYDLLIVHIDCDLYEPTKTVLNHLESRLVPGSIIIFDEFYDRNHERRAFGEFLASSRQKYECIGGTLAMAQAAFRRTS